MSKINRILIPGHPEQTICCDHVAAGREGQVVFFNGNYDHLAYGYGEDYKVVARLIGGVLVYYN